MEPVLLVCGGCGVRIRTFHPEKARARSCPRCQSSLAPAVDVALGIIPLRDEPRAGPSPIPARRLTTATLAILATIGSLASLAVRGASPDSESPAATPSAFAGSASSRSPIPLRSPDSHTAPAPLVRAEEAVEERLADLSGPPGPPTPALAILDLDRRDQGPPPPPEASLRIGSVDRPPSPPRPGGSTADEALVFGLTGEAREPLRHLVRDARGRAIVAREYGKYKDRLAAILPDGQIGWPEALLVTQKPFVPLTIDEMRQELLDDPEFTAFRVHQTAHYLVVYQCSEPFAKASGDLLEKLYDGLTSNLKKNGLPIQPLEFPLVAVIFATEDDFRANRRVPLEVQAYYEFTSNRIFFYEKSRRDQDSPEVSALRKPQTVAHEGTHQILNNVGIQPRLSDWPIWLVEGLAEYCSSAKFTRKGVDWAGIGQANAIHLATIRDLDDPLPNQFRGGRREAIVARDRQKPLVEYLVTRKDLTPTDYAFSWALTHYLFNQRLDELVAYVKRLSRLRPDEEQSPADQLAAFREAFGSDLAQLDGKVAKHLKKFKAGDALPYYAVIFEQQVGPVAVRRHYMVSQSPSVIRQWIESVKAPEGGPHHWQVFPHPTQKKALEAAEHWMTGGH